ncbi:MAG: hypothetical protein H8D34_28105 [Chloroflexi bacterium]|nr:hypothetical protein [Chloroflexota bacterium]
MSHSTQKEHFMTTRIGITLYARVAGVTFDNRQAAIAELVRSEALLIRREPHNVVVP